jgi:TolA-binding protein
MSGASGEMGATTMNQKRVIAVVVAASAGLILSMPAFSQEAARAVDNYNAASGMLSRGLDDLAIDEYRRFLDQHGDHELADQARYGLAVAASRLGRHEETIESLEPMLGKHRFQFAMESAMLVGRSKLTLGDSRESAAVLERAIGRHDDHRLVPQAAALLVEARYRGDQPDRAISTYEEYEHDLSGLVGERAAYFAGLAEAKLGRHQSAADRFARIGRGNTVLAEAALLAQGSSLQAIGRFEQALVAFTEAAVRAGDMPAFMARLGAAQVLSDLDRNAEAKDMLESIRARELDDLSKNRLDLERGRVATLLGDYVAADRILDEIRIAGPVSLRDDAAYWQARAFSQDGNPAKAALLLSGAVTEYDRSELLPEMMYELGIAQGKNGENEAAIETLRSFSRQFNGHTLAHQALLAAASFAQNSDDQNLASRLADEAADGLDGDAAYEARFLSAESAYQQDDFQTSARLFARLDEDIPSNHRLGDTVQYRLGMSLRQIGELQESQLVLRNLFNTNEVSEDFRAGLLALGDMAYSDMDWEAATNWLGRYVALGTDSPSWDAAALRLGLALKQDGERRAAQEIFTQIIDAEGIDSGHSRAHYELGLVLLELEELDQAAGAFKEAAALGDEEVAGYALRQLAQLAREEGNDAEAADYFARAADSSNGELAGVSSLEQARALLTSGSYENALQVLSELSENSEQADIRVKSHALSVIAIARLGEYKEAVDASEMFMRRPEVLEDLEDQMAASVLYERGRSLAAMKDVESAIESFSMMVDRYPEDRLVPHARLELAVLEMGEGQYEEAAMYCEDLLRETEDIDTAVADQASYRLGVCARELGEHNRAIDVLHALATREPLDRMSASASLLAGESNLHLGKLSEAQMFFEIASDYDDDSIRPVAMLRLGEVFGGLQYWTRAEETYAEFLGSYQDDERAYLAQFGSAWAKENLNRHDEAIEEYRTVVAQHDGETAARAQFQIGECLFAQNKHEEAVRELMRVDLVYAYPKWSAAALYEAGRCFEELDRTGDAISQYSDVVERFGDTDWAAMSERRLERLMPRTELGG